MVMLPSSIVVMEGISPGEGSVTLMVVVRVVVSVVGCVIVVVETLVVTEALVVVDTMLSVETFVIPPKLPTSKPATMPTASRAMMRMAKIRLSNPTSSKRGPVIYY